LISEPYISKIIGELTAEQKEVLFYTIKGHNTQKIACIRGQTDRNIRKVKNTALKQIRKKVYAYLTSNSEHNMTKQEKLFVENYRNMIDNDK
jgi:transcriptional regulator